MPLFTPDPFTAIFNSVLNSLEQLGGVPASSEPYRVLVVIQTDGTQYLPTTKVKNIAQANKLGLNTGDTIYIPVPETVNPQSIVDHWRQQVSGDNNILGFAQYWKPHGEHDYKDISPIYDAFGNFEFGASGEAAGFSLSTIQNAAAGVHLGYNSPQNIRDMALGFNAINNGSTLTTKSMLLVPVPQFITPGQ